MLINKAFVKFAPSSGAGVRTLSRSTASATFRFSSRASPWAGPRAPPALSLRGSVGRSCGAQPLGRKSGKKPSRPQSVQRPTKTVSHPRSQPGVGKSCPLLGNGSEFPSQPILNRLGCPVSQKLLDHAK